MSDILTWDDYLKEGGLVGEAVGGREDRVVRSGLEGLQGCDRNRDV